MPGEPIRVAELFAGGVVSRLGLEGHPESDEDTGFRVVFSNQWEPPGSGRQWASEIYEMHFGKEAHYNEDIHDIAYNEGDGATIRDRVHEHDLLVGDSPARTTQWPGRPPESSESRVRREAMGSHSQYNPREEASSEGSLARERPRLPEFPCQRSWA